MDNKEVIEHSALRKKKIHQGKNIQHLRIDKNWTQLILAEKIKVHQTDISDLEKKEIIDDETLEKLANAFDVSADDIKNFDFNEQFHRSIDNSYSTFNASSAENAHDSINQYQGNQIGSIIPIETFYKMYEDTLKLSTEKGELMYQNIALENENKLLKEKLKKYES